LVVGNNCTDVTLTISWSTAGSRSTAGVNVVIEGATFASGASGSQEAPWISARLARFDLYDGETLLDSARVNAD